MPREDVNLMESAFCLSTERPVPYELSWLPRHWNRAGMQQVVRWYVSRIGPPSSAAREPVGDPRYLISTSAAPRASAIAQWHPIYLLGGDFGIILPDGPNLHLHSTRPSSLVNFLPQDCREESRFRRRELPATLHFRLVMSFLVALLSLLSFVAQKGP